MLHASNWLLGEMVLGPLFRGQPHWYLEHSLISEAHQKGIESDQIMSEPVSFRAQQLDVSRPSLKDPL